LVAIASAGNVYRHEYEAVDTAIAWNTVHRELAPLRQIVVAELARLEVTE
jgi:hypothetical protein